MQLRKDGRFAQRCVVLLIPVTRDGHEPGLVQTLELPMNGAGSTPRQPDQLRALQPPFGLAEEKSEHALLDRSQEADATPLVAGLGVTLRIRE